MPQTAIAADDDKPQLGDRVKLCGNHRFAGFTGTYFTDRKTFAGFCPIIRLDHTGEETPVIDPGRQMRKL
jgi:hypothetical protein